MKTKCVGKKNLVKRPLSESEKTLYKKLARKYGVKVFFVNSLYISHIDGSPINHKSKFRLAVA